MKNNNLGYTVAIVGRPNVGKSTLFNKLTGRRTSIVDDTSGVTRDRVYDKCTWQGITFNLVDTGGIEAFADGVMPEKMKEQAEFAVESASVVIMVVDVNTGLVSADGDVAAYLKKCGKSVILCANKCDNTGTPNYNFYEFYNLGLGEPNPVSSIHGHGTGDLLDKVVEILKSLPEPIEDDLEYIDVAVIGKPNVGKSSLINYICGEQRSIVSDIAGTTRDTINTKIKNEFGNYNFLDTAGLRRKSKVHENIEKYSIIRTQMALENCHICVIMIDAVEGLTEQDVRVAGFAHEAGKGCIIAVNKWDALEKDNNTLELYRKNMSKKLEFMSYAPIIFISAKTGQRVRNLFEIINEVSNFNSMRISTGILNDNLAEFLISVPPPSDKGKRLKIYYMTQATTRPPTFVFFVNKAELFHFSYKRYLENCLRKTFGFTGTPIHFITREKGEKSKL